MATASPVLTATAAETQPKIRSQVRSKIDAPAALRVWHLTSLDAPTVALVWTLAFAWAARIALPPWLPAVVALAAWSMYIGDRLLDARTPRAPLRERHRFHWRHRRIFLPIALAAGCVAVTLVFRHMPAIALERNSVLAAAALAYLTTVHSPWRIAKLPRGLRIPKELLVGLLFTAACIAPAWFRGPASPVALAVPGVGLVALAWLNCHAIEAWESEQDGARPIFRIAMVLAGAAWLAAMMAAGVGLRRIAALLLAAAASAALLALLDRGKRRLTPIALRAAADLVLLTPLALLALK